MPAETSEEIDTMSHSTDARRNHLATCRPQNQQCMKRMPRLHVRQELDQIVCAQSSKDVTVGANPTMRKIVCQCVCGLHLRDTTRLYSLHPPGPGDRRFQILTTSKVFLTARAPSRRVSLTLMSRLLRPTNCHRARSIPSRGLR